ncbi:Oligosaccharyltransferase complex subunit ostc-B [Clonorchis sinensis]|uniref:Oligosaccharyltransferase complex subunit n=1 Tax=Clonorchis sinensis TaxID=79923 RepID=A0A8T1MMN8_CLOSI|nr:Oligosaccharyltransferase complex subunit ostc-B [Clonorchis sinensis]
MLYRLLFQVLECPSVRCKRPGFFKWPSPMMVFIFILVSYFLITGGVIYDMIVGPPSMGSETDARGNQRPVAIMVWRMNSQYILEGLAASFMFTLGSIGFIVMDKMNEARVTKLNRVLLMAFGISCIVISFITLRIFIKFKLPSYM